MTLPPQTAATPNDPRRRARLIVVISTVVSVVGLVVFAVAPGVSEVLLVQTFPAPTTALVIWGSVRALGAAVVVIGLIALSAGVGYLHALRHLRAEV